MDISFWEKMNEKIWTKLPYPWKPSFCDLMVYGFFILSCRIKSRPAKKQNILVVGATKEIRKILSSLKLPYDLVDFSSNMEKNTKPQKDSMSTFLKNDWESFLPYKKYDLILGDLILNLLTKEKIETLLDTLFLSLEKGGNIVVRHRFLGKLNGDHISLVKNQLINLDKETLYLLFANLLSLREFDKEEYVVALHIINQSDEFWVKVFQKDFLKNLPGYHIYSENEVSDLLEKYQPTIMRKSKPKNYIDSYKIILIKNGN